LLNELEEWAKTALHDNPRPVSSSQKQGIDRERFLLRMYYWSTKILITRPCLCRMERRISLESDKSVNINTKMAEICVGAAQEMTKLFPNNPDTNFIYSQGPWWDVVHISEYRLSKQDLVSAN
jgi:hypothetical protein